MSYGTSVTLDIPFADAADRVRAALKDQGFGVLTEIDVTATMAAKLGEQIEDYIILGACNPPFAFQALGIDRSIGLLLPCNVVVRATAAGTVVEALDPQVMVTLTGRPELKPVADEVAHRLASALASVASLRRQAQQRWRHAMPSRRIGAESAGHHVSVRTTCGREIRIGHLALGGGSHPAQRVSLDISASSDTEDGTWAGLTADEARQLAAALLVHAATCERWTYT